MGAFAEGACFRSSPVPPLAQDGWLLGSVLQSHDLTALSPGATFATPARTIWTRHLKVTPPNPYWEIKHDLVHMMTVTRGRDERLLLDFPSAFCQANGVAPADLFVVSADEAIARTFTAAEIDFRVPFHVDGRRLGEYHKFFLRRPQGVFPLFDVVTFDMHGDTFTELHLNIAHLEVAIGLVPTIHGSSGKRAVSDLLGISPDMGTLTSSMRTLRLLALSDALLAASDAGLRAGPSRGGHEVKKIAKMLALDAQVLSAPVDALLALIDADLARVVRDEQRRTSSLDVDAFLSMDHEVRASTHGITDEHLAIARGEARDERVLPPGRDARYFTDIPHFGAMPVDEWSRQLRCIGVRRGLVAGSETAR
ncbi:hypothetical protein AES38_03315 [Clavibacter capsici]|uniref:Uncharacterized protein n=1 Tax=Clavibacter capsici TaxID=1874630 RepID=A0AAE6XPX1_9MICO|nr:hypothetical protein [Clavibacter capsici]ALD12092.1 hypothetical protein AES38_03315 [Clavibacter capsici]QIS44191.1 hypothetical protein GW570_03330 [Clavibacter capsici]